MSRGLPPDIPRKRVNAVVVNGRMVEVFEALCYLEGRRAHELVHDAVLAYCRERENDPDVAECIRIGRRYRSGLRLIEGGATG